MIRNQDIERKFREQRLDAKTLDNLFRRRIEVGANCSPFVSGAILQTLKEVYPLGLDDCGPGQLPGLGQIKLLVVDAGEPAGKSLEQCQKVTVTLTLDAGVDDYHTRRAHGVEGLRRARLLRMTAEARDQGGLLSYEDLAFRLLNCGVRTIVRDVKALKKNDVEVPSRGQQQDIGPGLTHRVQAVRFYLQGLEANEIARRLYHSLASIENYVTTFARVAFLVDRKHADDEIAFIVRRSQYLVAAYRQLYLDACENKSYRMRLREIRGRSDGIPISFRADATKKPGVAANQSADTPDTSGTPNAQKKGARR